MNFVCNNMQCGSCHMKRFFLLSLMCVGLLAAASPSRADLVYSQDAIQFDGLNSGNSLIGTTCVAGQYDACVQVTGGVQDITSLINSFISQGQICCGNSDISVQINNAGTSTVTVADDFYGPFTGSVSSTDTGSADTLNWASAVYGSPFSINFTDASGIITDALFNVGSAQTNTAAPTSDVPEPATLALLGIGFTAVGAVRKRSRK
jgi:hypothetical protein